VDAARFAAAVPEQGERRARAIGEVQRGFRGCDELLVTFRSFVDPSHRNGGGMTRRLVPTIAVVAALAVGVGLSIDHAIAISPGAAV